MGAVLVDVGEDDPLGALVMAVVGADDSAPYADTNEAINMEVKAIALINRDDTGMIATMLILARARWNLRQKKEVPRS